ncbi:GNAT family N-acetyltransferase [Vibrio sp. HN007]|uniref:GNAT family N-acetyltransferase n=1 Tax=Vibrio iocasae TaxID=3098914 RepID=UPI0035D44C4F
MNYQLYKETQTEEIIHLFTQTFTDSEGKEEGALIGKLTSDLLATTPKKDIYVFIAEENEQIAGSILFTRLTFASDKTAFLMAPVAVSTHCQGNGIGQKLIRFGLDSMKQQGVDLAFTYGDPNYYTKTGFEQITEKEFKAPMPLSLPHGWMAQSLTEEELESISGESSCVQAFDNPALW